MVRQLVENSELKGSLVHIIRGRDMLKWLGSAVCAAAMMLPSLEAIEVDALVQSLVLRDVRAGVVSRADLGSVGLEPHFLDRVEHRISDFNDELQKVPTEGRASSIEKFHQGLYDFIIKEHSVNVFRPFSGQFGLGFGHQSDVSLRPDGESVPSGVSSVTRDWNLKTLWSGRMTPWGKWSLGLDSVGRDYERSAAEAWDHHEVKAHVGASYLSGWRWRYHQAWHLYGVSGSSDLGDAQSRVDIGYGRADVHRPFLKEWDVALRVQYDNFKALESRDALGNNRDRWLTKLTSRWDYHLNGYKGDLVVSVSPSVANSASSSSDLEYFAFAAKVSADYSCHQSPVAWRLVAEQEKRTNHRRVAGKANDALTQASLEAKRPLWNDKVVGSAKAYYQDLRSKQSSVEFSSEGVVVGMDLSW